MYVAPAFAEDDPAALAAMVRAHPLAMLAVNGAEGPVVAHVPFAVEVDCEGALTALVGHVARANGVWREADGEPAVAVFCGPDAYVSPSYYPSKAEHGRVVPTWDYERVEVRGTLSVEPDGAAMRPYLDAPTRQLEAGRRAPWAVDDAPAAFVAQLSHAVVGLRLTVTRVTGSRKLSQNRPDADYAGVHAAFASSELPSERAVAAAMARLRQP